MNGYFLELHSGLSVAAGSLCIRVGTITSPPVGAGVDALEWMPQMNRGGCWFSSQL